MLGFTPSHQHPLASFESSLEFSRVETLEPRVFLAANLPTFDHVVIVMEENKASSQIIGSSDAPYINSLADTGANFTNSHGVTHPSQPNYLALFSGSTQGVTDNGTYNFSGPNLATQLYAAGESFLGYAEAPSVRKHDPWESFTNAAQYGRDFSQFPTDFTNLPTVSMVSPNENNDMHDGSIAQGDTWLKNNLGDYATWAKAHNSLLIVHFDEDDGSHGNLVATVFYGAQVKTGDYNNDIDHYDLLRTVQDMYGLGTLANSASATAITNVWDLVSTVVPAAPTNVAARAISPSQVDVSWVEQSTGVTGFKLERSVNGGAFVPLATLDALQTSYSDKGLSANTLYAYRVRAVNGALESANSLTASAVTLPAPLVVPAVPTRLLVNAVSATEVVVSWEQASGAVGYKLERSTGAGAFAQIAQLDAEQISYSDTGLLPETAYTYRVRAFNDAGDSDYSLQASTVTPAPAPGPVPNPNGVYEAEAAALFGVVEATDHPGFTGTGFGDYQNPTGDFIEWTVNANAAGAYQLDFTYANGRTPARRLDVTVNGVSIGTVDFTSTGSWNLWGDLSLETPLNAGANAVRATAIGASGPNIDKLTVTTLAAALTPTDDAFVRDGVWSDTNYGSLTELLTKQNETDWNRLTYLKFDLSDWVTISDARLRLFGGFNHASDVPVETVAFAVSDSTWKEATILWSNKPTLSAESIATTTVTDDEPTWHEWDLTSYLQQEKLAGHTTVTIALTNTAFTDPYGTWNSKEADDNRPELNVKA